MATVATRAQIHESRGQIRNNPVLGNFIPLGSHAQDTSISAATTITASDDKATHVMLQNSDPSINVRYTIDGTAPTASLGFLLEPGWYAIIPVQNVTLKVIETAVGGQVDYQEVMGI